MITLLFAFWAVSLCNAVYLNAVMGLPDGKHPKDVSEAKTHAEPSQNTICFIVTACQGRLSESVCS